jgi:NitT/TauT family transport system permease protein
VAQTARLPSSTEASQASAAEDSGRFSALVEGARRRLGPPLVAVAVALALWQFVAWSGWKPAWVLPGPVPVFRRLGAELASGEVFAAARITLGRALVGFSIAIAAGTLLGVAMAKARVVRNALKGVIVGLQTMPSVAWFPLAILLFQLGEESIQFVIVLGAAPSIAVGLVSAVDHVPPLLLRVGRTMGASGFTLFRRVVFPAALPGYVAGLKQGWAFSWRSLMAGELMVFMADRPSIGARLHFARELSDAEGLLAWMIVVLIVGIFVDLAVFGRAEKVLRERRGLGEEH